MSFLGRVMAFEAHGHIIYFHFMFVHWKKSLRARIKMVEDMKADPERREERTLYVFEVEDQALSYTRIPGVYNCDPRCKDLFYASVSERVINLTKKGATWYSMLEMVEYSVRGETPPQHPGPVNLTTNIPRLP